MRLLVAIAIGAVGAVLNAQGVDSAQVATRARALMHDLARRRLFQGAVVLGSRDRVWYAEGFGLANREMRTPFTPDTPADGASIAKPFTAAAVLMLVREGRLQLDDLVRTLVPEYPHAGTRVRDLLGHAAGLPPYEWLDARVDSGAVRTNAGHLALIAREQPPPGFPPGTAFSYDNVAYDAAALLVERASGRSYAQFIEERLSGPAGLRAFVRPARFADWVGVRTRGYRRTATGWRLHDAFDLEGFHGADNIYLSARDIFRWMSAYRAVVGREVAEHAQASVHLPGGGVTGISLGSWYVSGRRRHYGGHHQGFHSVGYADDERGITVAWIANDTPPAWLHTALTRALVAIMEGVRPERMVPPPPGTFRGDPSGRYAVPGVGEVKVLREGGRLIAAVAGVDYESFEVERGVFYVPGVDAYLRFRRGDGGAVTLHWDAVYVSVRGVRRMS